MDFKTLSENIKKIIYYMNLLMHIYSLLKS